jgi:hypothetical protein
VLRVIGYWPDCATLVPLCEVVTCLQVLEHLDQPEPFCAALFAHARQAVILSLPWHWPAGTDASHKQDPVGGDKVLLWTGRDPTSCRVTPGTRPRAVLLYQI